MKVELMLKLIYYMFRYSYNKIFWRLRKFCEIDQKGWWWLATLKTTTPPPKALDGKELMHIF